MGIFSTLPTPANIFVVRIRWLLSVVMVWLLVLLLLLLLSPKSRAHVTHQEYVHKHNALYDVIPSFFWSGIIAITFFELGTISFWRTYRIMLRSSLLSFRKTLVPLRKHLDIFLESNTYLLHWNRVPVYRSLCWQTQPNTTVNVQQIKITKIWIARFGAFQQLQ